MVIPIPKRHCFIENCLSPSSQLSGNDRELGDIFPPRCAINSPIMDAIHYMYWPKVWRWRLMYFLGWVGRRGIEKQEVKVCSKQWRNEHNRRMKEKEKTNERRRTSRGGREQKTKRKNRDWEKTGEGRPEETREQHKRTRKKRETRRTKIQRERARRRERQRENRETRIKKRDQRERISEEKRRKNRNEERKAFVFAPPQAIVLKWQHNYLVTVASMRE